jgi:hypothetical protein
MEELEGGECKSVAGENGKYGTKPTKPSDQTSSDSTNSGATRTAKKHLGKWKNK